MTFEFTKEEAQLILNALSELPYRISSGVIAKLQEQATKQMTDN